MSVLGLATTYENYTLILQHLPQFWQGVLASVLAAIVVAIACAHWAQAL